MTNKKKENDASPPYNNSWLEKKRKRGVYSHNYDRERDSITPIQSGDLPILWWQDYLHCFVLTTIIPKNKREPCGHTPEKSCLNAIVVPAYPLSKQAFLLSHELQQKNMLLLTFWCNLGSSGTKTGPAEVTPPWLEDVSDISSNLMNWDTWVAARCA